MAEAIHTLARRKGWWETERNTGELLMLAVSELSEALEDYRVGRMETTTDADGKPIGFPTELADTVIRVMDTAFAMGIDLQAEIARKMTYNTTRPYRHGGKRA
ncbi:MAG: hypothetical protein ABFE01_11420 [Phycisphaerales bacterium]